MINVVKRKIFNAILLTDALERLEKDGISVGHAKATPAERGIVEVGAFSPRIRARAERMQHLYVAFYCLENSVRDLISQRLAERHGTDWWVTKVPTRVQSYVDNLQKGERKTKYLGSRSQTQIGYTLFSHLTHVIIDNWQDFDDLFPDQAWITSRFKDLEACRNILMHTNQLSDDQSRRIDAIVRDWLSQVG